MEVRIGSAIPADAMDSVSDDREATEYLRWRTYLLARRSKAEVLWHTACVRGFVQNPGAGGGSGSPGCSRRKSKALPADRCLAENGEFAVYLGTAQRDSAATAGSGKTARAYIPRRWRGNGQEPRSRFFRRILFAHPAVAQNEARVGGGLSRRQHSGNSRGARDQRPLHQHSVSLRREHLPEARAGDGTRAFLRAAGISAAIRATAAAVEGDCAYGRETAGDSRAVRRGQHQQRLQRSVARNDLSVF